MDNLKLVISDFCRGCSNLSCCGRIGCLIEEQISSFTQRELEVFDLIKQGYSNKEISEILFVSYHTAKAYTASILYKLKMKNRVVVAFYAGRKESNNIISKH